jgi:Peptidase family M23
MIRLTRRMQIRPLRNMSHRFDATYGEWRIRGRQLCAGGGVRHPIAGASAQVWVASGAAPDRLTRSRSVGAPDEQEGRVVVSIDLADGQRVTLAVPPGEETRARVFVQLINQAGKYFGAIEAADPTTRHRSTFQIASARARMPLLCVGVAVMVAGVLTVTAIYWMGLCVLAGGLACYFRFGVHGGEAMKIHPPVRGRWIAMNSPADRVPSHHVTAYGQGQAVDLVYDSASRPGLGWWPLARRPQAFPGFGQPVLSPVDGVVIRMVSGHRDHWSRTSWPALLYLVVEGVREFLGPSHILGNHVVIDCGGRRYAVLAHLRRRSVLVREGQHVNIGQLIAECGNSGNSTEPHVHVQVMDHPRPLFAAGIPIVFGTRGDSGWMPRANQELDSKSA